MDKTEAAKLLAAMRGYLLKLDLIREQFRELNPRMSREVLLTLQGE